MKQFYHDEIVDVDTFWQKLLMADRRKFAMCCSTYSGADKDVDSQDVLESGLQDGHAYTLIGVKEIIKDDMKIERLLKVRNPYGRKEWQGDWSDKSKKWTVKTRD